MVTNNGTLNIAADSTLDVRSAGLTNIGSDSNGGVLSGGTYIIGGRLLYSGSDIVTLGAGTSLTMDGSGNIYNAATINSTLTTLSLNNGTLILQNGAFIYAGDGSANTGTVDIESGTKLTADSGTDNTRRPAGPRRWTALWSRRQPMSRAAH